MEVTVNRNTDLASRERALDSAIGAIFLGQGRLNQENIESILNYATQHGVRFGDAAVRLNLLTRQDVDSALARQFKPAMAARGVDGVDVLMARDPQNISIEPVRALRSQLMFSWLKTTSGKVLAVTSAGRGEGRSWLAANLAVAFAQTDKRVLLIDADMRNPQQHRLFDLDNRLGLSSLLTGRQGTAAAPSVCPQINLFVLTAGSPPPNPQELLAGSSFKLVIERFATQYDVVLVDTPAASEFSDAQLIAGLAGSAILLARRHQTRHDKLADAMRQLRVASANVVGCVMNEY